MKQESPDLLRALWERFEAHYVRQLGRKPSKREMSAQLGFDPSVISKWMQHDAPRNGRIPTEHIAVLAQAMMLTPKETDRLMSARLFEMAAHEPGINATIKWVADSVTRKVTQRHALDEDEKQVLAAFRLARDNFPRGLYGDAQEASLLVAQMQISLERAEALHIEEAQADSANADPVRANTERLKAAMQANARKSIKPVTVAVKQAKATRLANQSTKMR